MPSILTRFTTEEKKAILRALTPDADSLARWKKLAETGATDAQLTLFLDKEMTEGGTGGPKPTVSEAHHHRPPRIWLHQYSPYTRAKPTLQGKELLQVARILFKVGHQRNDQLALFDVFEETDLIEKSPERDEDLAHLTFEQLFADARPSRLQHVVKDQLRPIREQMRQYDLRIFD
jgi:hypothetical protein